MSRDKFSGKYRGRVCCEHSPEHLTHAVSPCRYHTGSKAGGLTMTAALIMFRTDNTLRPLILPVTGQDSRPARNENSQKDSLQLPELRSLRLRDFSCHTTALLIVGYHLRLRLGKTQLEEPLRDCCVTVAPVPKPFLKHRHVECRTREYASPKSKVSRYHDELRHKLPH